ncbi:hypothetical protein DV737_g1195, partial [Chaetothyriales sp. CBS 132003]
MASNPPSYAFPGSMSRSKTSRDDIGSLADKMLQASLTRGAASPASVSSAASVLYPPPSYRHSTTPVFSASSSPYNTADGLSCGQNAGAVHPPIPGSASITDDNITGYRKSTSVSSSHSTLSISAADAKSRVRHLQQEVERAKADMPERQTRGLFKAACSTDLLFLMDTTNSMIPYMEAAKNQVRSIVGDIKRKFLNEADVRVAVVSYKDHNDDRNIEFLDFTQSANQVFKFLGRLSPRYGKDKPEDVLGGVHQALKASWKQQTRCIIHIADAPPHGAGVLHDFRASSDYYPRPGSEPHGLTHEPLLKQLIKLNINYALLRINNSTDRMGFVFAQAYAASGADVKLLPSNRYSNQVNNMSLKSGRGLWSGASKPQANLQFEEMELGKAYSQLQHLVVRTVTTSATRTAGCMSLALASPPKLSAIGETRKKVATGFSAIREDEGSDENTKGISLETDPPCWDTPGWLDETLEVEGFCPDLVVQSANSLNEMMEADENIKLSVVQFTIHARSKPFAEGSVRVAAYARTSASTSKFVVKSFKEDGKTLAHLAEDMRIQALCKAFALEFNGLLKIEPPIDFLVTTCLQSKSKVGSEGGCLSLEPYIEGEYGKYNTNSMFVKEESPDGPDPFNPIAQAFSHFTFERSWGHFLVNDLQGVGHLLTDPAIQTRDKERFKLTDTNFNEEGFKFFFASHKCNSFCHKLELKSNREMVSSGQFEFREFWPTVEATVCCSNKLCRRIVRLAGTHESDTFPGHHWCDACWAQLQASMVMWICAAPGAIHEFHTSKFFYESQGQLPPRKCPEHVERDMSVSSAAVVGGSLWSRMKAAGPKRSISGRSW